MKCYEVTAGDALKWLLEECLNQGADTLLVTMSPFEDSRKRRSYPKGVEARAREILGSNLIKVFEANGWPGTELVRHSGRVLAARFDSSLAERVIQEEPDLFKWTHNRVPPLPENICVLSAARFDSPLLVSVTHEGMAWMIPAKRVSNPSLAPTELRPKDLMLGKDRFFCTPAV